MLLQALCCPAGRRRPLSIARFPVDGVQVFCHLALRSPRPPFVLATPLPFLFKSRCHNISAISVSISGDITFQSLVLRTGAVAGAKEPLGLLSGDFGGENDNGSITQRDSISAGERQMPAFICSVMPDRNSGRSHHPVDVRRMSHHPLPVRRHFAPRIRFPPTDSKPLKLQ